MNQVEAVRVLQRRLALHGKAIAEAETEFAQAKSVRDAARRDGDRMTAWHITRWLKKSRQAIIIAGRQQKLDRILRRMLNEANKNGISHI